MGSYGIRNLLDAHRRYHFLLTRDLEEFLRQKIVIVGRDELWDIANNSEYVEFALRHSLIGQVNVMEGESE